ncbi:hypothetical protein HPP92_004816 [Vanilla planifolia]|uniref:Uncharacterized protein n=1 Tax=Vanilla planifolia TaxID=51239 RepID=A0A835RSL2_VANPL|nr:hypothetical protein HPP92_004816 [Vanilla planifolia]
MKTPCNQGQEGRIPRLVGGETGNPTTIPVAVTSAAAELDPLFSEIPLFVPGNRNRAVLLARVNDLRIWRSALGFLLRCPMSRVPYRHLHGVDDGLQKFMNDFLFRVV